MFTGRDGKALRNAGPLLACMAVAAASFALPARADLADNLSEIVYQVEVSSANGSASYYVTQDMGTFINPQTFMWSLPGPVELMDGDGDLIATLGGGSCAYMGDPQIGLGFSIMAGNVDTIVTITSALLSFPTINNPAGLVSAGITLTDSNGNGGLLVSPNNVIATYQYNGFVPGGTVFANLTHGPGGLVAPPGQSIAGSANTGGFLPIGVPVMDMSLQFSFTLSAFDQASATNAYVIQSLPAPAGLGLLAVAGLMGSRRRRA